MADGGTGRIVDGSVAGPAGPPERAPARRGARLHGHLPGIARVAVRLFYRFEAAGAAVPAAGPVVLVANHPNGLMDPLLVAAAARRPLRFLAKAPLFRYPVLGPFVRAVGAIPVHRPSDDPAAAAQNAGTFRAAHEALAAGDAIALFPEGISHDEPALAQLRTGAARIALGAAARAGAFPLVPVGIVLREKETFRSEALVVAGEPVAWADLAARGPDDAEAVRALTARLAEGLRRVTLNLERWEDAPLVECAEGIYTAELGPGGGPAERLERLRVTAEALAEVRRGGRPDLTALVRAVGRHRRALERLHLHPRDLHTDLRGDTALAWTLRRLPLVSLPLVAVAAVGLAAWWIPYRLTGALVELLRPSRDVEATYKGYGGALVFALWLGVLASVVGTVATAGAGMLVFLGLPLLGLAALWIHERWTDAWLEMRRFFLLRRNPHLLRHLRRDQRELAERLAGAAAGRPSPVPGAGPGFGVGGLIPGRPSQQYAPASSHS